MTNENTGNWAYWIRNGYGWYSSVIILMSIMHTLSVGADLVGDPELLRLVAEAHRDSYKRIETWVGKADIRTTHGFSDGVTTDKTGHSAVFAYDQLLGATRWNKVSYERLERTGNELVSVFTRPYHTSGMRTKEAFYRAIPETRRTDRPFNSVVIFPIEEENLEYLAGDFDPMWYLKEKGEDVVSRLMTIYEHRKDFPGAGVKREGDIVSFEQNGDGLGYTAQYDLSKGGNLVHLRAFDTTVTETYHWTYQKIEDVWIPDRYTYENRNIGYGGTGKTYIMTQEISFTENRLNQPVDPSEFTIQKLGITPGIYIGDRVLGISYKFGELMNEKAVMEDLELQQVALVVPAGTTESRPPTSTPTVDKVPPAPLQQNPASDRRSILCPAIGAGLILLVVLTLRKRAKRRN